MLSLIYVSSAIRTWPSSELVALLEHARENNARLGITGLLLYQNGGFIQTLEGPDETVTHLFATIAADPRHHRVMQLMKREVSDRDFPEWSMGFQDLGDPEVRKLPGYNDYLTLSVTGHEYRDNPSLARRLFSVFRNSMHPHRF